MEEQDKTEPDEEEQRSGTPPTLSTWKGAVIKDGSLWVKWRFGNSGQVELRFNPVVVLMSLLLIAGVGMWCIIGTEDAGKQLGEGDKTVSGGFSWFYTLSRTFWIFFVLGLYFSEHGSVKLGKDRDKPQYSDITWFSMVLCSGVGVGMFLHGASEPVYHYTRPNKHTADGYSPDNELAETALTLAFSHWGLHSWVAYLVVALALGFVGHRKGLPMTIRSCLYPLIGARVYSWVGDLVDILTVVSTVLALSSVLGVGAVQINAGLNSVFPATNISSSTISRTIIVWSLTAASAACTLCGGGVRRVCQLCLAVAVLLTFTVLLSDDTSFLLTLFLQTTGNYLHYVIKFGLSGDAMEEMNITSAQGADRGREFKDGAGDGPTGWTQLWTFYYWGVWMSWTPFVGMFIARISKGRTVREVIKGALIAPITFCFLWVATFGGAALRSERYAASLVSEQTPFCCPADPDLLNWQAGVLAGAKWRDELVKDVQEKYSGYDDVESCTKKFIVLWDDHWKDKTEVGLEFTNFGTFYNISKNRYKISLVRPEDELYLLNKNRTAARLSCISPADLWFSLMYSYQNVGHMLSVASLVAIVLFIITSSSAGVLIVDSTTTNGDNHPPRVQRIFWCCVTGGVASAALAAKGEVALTALQTAGVLAALPFYLILTVLCLSLWRGLQMECGNVNPYGVDFTVGVIDPITTWRPALWCSFIKNIFLAPVTVYTVSVKIGTSKREAAVSCLLAYFCWTCWIFLLILDTQIPGWNAVGWVCYLAHSYVISAARGAVRQRYQIHGSTIEDLLAAVLLYPCVGVQLQAAMVRRGLSTALPLPYRVTRPKSYKKIIA